MNEGLTVERKLPSGRTVKVTIDDSGYVTVEGAQGVTASYHFHFSHLGYGYVQPRDGDNNRIAVRTEQNHNGIETEFMESIEGKPLWWSPFERPAMRLFGVGSTKKNSFDGVPRFLLQFREGNKHQFHALESYPFTRASQFS